MWVCVCVCERERERESASERKHMFKPSTAAEMEDHHFGKEHGYRLNSFLIPLSDHVQLPAGTDEEHACAPHLIPGWVTIHHQTVSDELDSFSVL
jgi:hypothetical protein